MSTADFPADAWADVEQPTLIIDKDRVRRNIERMLGKAKSSGVRFRPHFKTHASVEVGTWFRDLGVTAIMVSSIDMAEQFATAGWGDITLGLFNPRALPAIERLSRAVRLGVLVDSPESARVLSSIAAAVDAWIDVDTGYGRTGITWDDDSQLAEVLRTLQASPHRVRGVLTHAGESYFAASPREIDSVYRRSVQRMNEARDRLAAESSQPLEISIGDTPCCSIESDFSGVDEIRPGNFVFYDLQQLALGSCTRSDLALAVACPLLGVYPDRGHAVVQGGTIHFSRDIVGPEQPIHGWMVGLGGGSWDLMPRDCRLESLSQEHGEVVAPPDVLAGMHVGDLAVIVPAHACMASNLIRRAVVVDGEFTRRGLV